jgi:hypothetical protein
MATLIDLIGSLIFGGALLMIALDANSAAREIQDKYAGDLYVQRDLTEVVAGVESEFRNMGFGVPDTAATILAADTSSITFVCNTNGTGIGVDTIRYYVGTTAEMASTQNELDRPLYRKQNSDAATLVGIVTVFNLRYIDYNKSIMTTPVTGVSLRNVQEVEITLEVQNPYADYRQAGTVQSGERNALYSSSLWQQTRLASQNFKR